MAEKKKGGFVGLLKSAGLVDFDENTSKAPEKNPTTVPVFMSAAQNNPMPSAQTFKGNISAEELSKFIEHFNQILDKANLPGPDYFEFSMVLESPAMGSFDERTRVAASYASLVPQGLTKDKLLSSASAYIDILNKDKEGFAKALKAKLDQEVSGRETQIKAIEEEIVTKTKQIQELTKSVSDAQGLISGLKTEIGEASARIQKNEGAYLAACDAFIQKIQNNVQKIQNI